MSDDKVVPLRDPFTNVVRTLEQSLEHAQESRPFGVIVLTVGDEGLRVQYNEELRAESAIAIYEVAKRQAVDLLTDEVILF